MERIGDIVTGSKDERTVVAAYRAAISQGKLALDIAKAQEPKRVAHAHLHATVPRPLNPICQEIERLSDGEIGADFVGCMLEQRLDHQVVDLAHRYDVDPSFLDDLHAAVPASQQPASTDRVRAIAARLGYQINIVESGAGDEK